LPLTHNQHDQHHQHHQHHQHCPHQLQAVSIPEAAFVLPEGDIMVLIVGIAGAAALAVLLYNHLREQQPELATLSTRRAQQLAAVVLVLSKAVDGVIDALTLGLRPAVSSSNSSSWRSQRLVDVDWDDQEDDDAR